jgi:catechol-2,3-dioxygenase
MTKLNHMVLKVLSNSECVNFYTKFFKLLNLTEVYSLDYYKHFENNFLSIGLYFEATFENYKENYAGLGHIAFEIENIEILENIISFLKENSIEVLGPENKKHHGKEYLTIEFRCPSNIRIECVLKN